MNPTEMGRLPGGEIVARGLADLAASRDTTDAAAVAMASTRLRDAGVPVPELAERVEPAAHHLYALLAREHGDGAHAHYNAIVRRIVSFAQAAERARGGRA
jgi:hypothetical protein